MSLDPRSPFSQHHPLAGKITAGIRTTENRARLPNVSMQLTDIPSITMADRAQQMFGLQDRKGTRVYFAENGVFNTVDERGMPITFIGGLFKTMNKGVCDFLQQFVEAHKINYLELEEDPKDAEAQPESARESVSAEHIPGGPVSISRPVQRHEQESPYAGEADPSRSGSGGSYAGGPKQSTHGAAVGSSGGDGNGGESEGLEDTQPIEQPGLTPQEYEAVENARPVPAKKPSLRDKLKKKE